VSRGDKGRRDTGAAKARRAGARPISAANASQSAAGRQERGRGIFRLHALRRLLRLTLLLVAVIVAAAGVITLYRSPLFRVRTVVVQNARHVDPEVIAQASGFVGQNMLTLDVQDGVSRVRRLPMVRSVDVQRQIPNTVRITVHEREPWGYWEVAGGRYVIDQEGIVINRGLPVEGAPLVMQMDGGRPLSVGESVDPDALGLVQALQQRLPEALPTARTQSVTYEFRSRDGLTAVVKGGLRITFGDSHDLEYKLSALRALLSRAPDATFIDLRFGDRIVFQTPDRPAKR
jgi:cell division protein FtsQ